VAGISTIFWDVGGVILSNGWDRPARAEAARKFGIDWNDFEDRHELSSPGFETGKVTLATYLDRTIFCRPRTFSREEFRDFMFSQSRELPGARAVLDELAQSGRYLQATMNNEALELNLYRIERFDLKRDFAAFFSSCFVGARKPDREIYQIALEVTQRDPERCLFIDDRALNLECARQLGMHTIQYRDAKQLREELAALGVPVAAA
jgi:putative hydrolase of the HAD superfamily